mmetsp:Transcript_13878/g.35519  ORF Transcript_13878/g.35519 Transcript_13878/m.35519 type:complete len:210 (-) Transcript_13878:1101-1730(-)
MISARLRAKVIQNRCYQGLPALASSQPKESRIERDLMTTAFAKPIPEATAAWRRRTRSGKALRVDEGCSPRKEPTPSCCLLQSQASSRGLRPTAWPTPQRLRHPQGHRPCPWPQRRRRSSTRPWALPRLPVGQAHRQAIGWPAGGLQGAPAAAALEARAATDHRHQLSSRGATSPTCARPCPGIVCPFLLQVERAAGEAMARRASCLAA